VTVGAAPARPKGRFGGQPARVADQVTVGSPRGPLPAVARLAWLTVGQVPARLAWL